MIQVKNISFKYPGTKRNIFTDFSLDIKANNVYGLLGKNGTGKSTLLYLLTSSLRTPKIFIKEFGDFLMSCHQHCLGVNLLVQR